MHLSLKRLGTDYVDLWQVHEIVSQEEIERVMKDKRPARFKRAPSLNLVLRLQRCKTEVLMFMHDLRVLFTNNFAERERADDQVATEDQRVLSNLLVRG